LKTETSFIFYLLTRFKAFVKVFTADVSKFAAKGNAVKSN